HAFRGRFVHRPRSAERNQPPAGPGGAAPRHRRDETLIDSAGGWWPDKREVTSHSCGRLLPPVDLRFGNAERSGVALGGGARVTIPSSIAERPSREDDEGLLRGAEVAIPASDGIEGIAQGNRA